MGLEEMTTILFMLLGAASVTYLWVVAEPMVRLRYWLGIDPDAENDVKSFIGRLCSCCLCSGFWVGLIVFWGWNGFIFLAALTSVLAELIYIKLNK